jgi:hypothetical protein
VTDIWTIDASDGELLVHTGVAGRAAKMGHRLTIAMKRWQATVTWSDGEPAAAQLEVDVDSDQRVVGHGVKVYRMSGLRSSTGGDKIAPKVLPAEAVGGPEGPMTTGAHDDCSAFGFWSPRIAR